MSGARVPASRARTNRLWISSSVSSTASTAAASPRVFSTQVPTSSSFVRSIRIASSSSRAIASGHQDAPRAMISSRCLGSCAVRRADGDDCRALATDRLRRRRTSSDSRWRRSCAPSGVSSTPRASRRAVALRRERRARARFTFAANCWGLATSSTSRHSFARVAANAFGRRAEHVGVIAPHAALVGQARQAARARQHAEQWHLRQADGG